MTVPIDDELLVLVSVALPVAAGVYCGWSDRARSRRARLTGLGAAVAGAVLGAWLGFAAGEGLIAPFTAIAGAVAAANLALIALDVCAPRKRDEDLIPPTQERREVYAMAG